jgi:CDP-diacylglycerol---glycerol-3-phosphate 3-phosphatidyltransferase
MNNYALQHKNALYNLRIRWMFLAGLSAAFSLITYRLLAGYWHQSNAERWLSLSLGVIVLLLWTLWRNLSANYRQGERQLLPTLGIGNTLTFLRGLFVAVTAGFILSPPQDDRLLLLPAAFYTLAALGDFLDGYIARRQDHATRMGEILDMYVDGIGLLVATLLLVQYGKVPAWYLLVGLARHLFLVGIWIRKRMQKPVYPLPSSDVRRALAAVQMSFIFILLWPLFSPPATTIAATAFAIPFLVNFLRDWLIVIGVIPSQTGIPILGKQFFLRWLPLSLRIVIFTLTISIALTSLLNSPPQPDLHTRFGLPAQEFSLAILIILYLIVPLMLLFGLAGRAAALTGLILIGISQNFTPLTSVQMLLVIMLTAIFHLGTGSLSLWKPEDHLISLRAGQRAARTMPAEPVSLSSAPLGSAGSSLTEVS